MKDEKKKIIFIVPTLKGGGAEKNVINTINGLNSADFSITLIVIGGEDNYGHLLPVHVKIFKLNRNRVLSGVWPSISIIRGIKPDIVFSSAPHLSLAITLFNVVFFKKIVNVIRVPTLPSNQLSTDWKQRIMNYLNKFVYSMADKLIVQTDQMRAEVVDFLGIDSSKTIVIPNVINVEQVKTLATENTSDMMQINYTNIIAAGTLYSVKGFDVLIKAMKIVIESNDNIRLHILGHENTESGYKKFLDNLIEDLDLGAYITFHGFKSNPYPYIRQADLFVLSSRKEGFPNVVLESLVLGTPVVATSCIDFSGIIEEGKNGVIVPVENIERLAEAILIVVKYPKFTYSVNNFEFNSWFQNIEK